METKKAYDNFPAGIVILSNLVAILIYGLGFFITLRLGWVAAVLFLLFVLILEYRLISKHCVDCFYWGKTCGFGKGRASAMFFKKGHTSKFCEKEISWKEMVPDFLVTLIPLVTGIIFLFIKFSFLLLTATVLLTTLATIGNGYIRGSLTCKFCKQKEFGCPAEKMFSRANERNKL
jgi:hypothetical protein